MIKNFYKKKNNLYIMLVILVVIFVVILGYIYMNRHVKFKDSNMAYEISRTIGPNVNPENVKYKDVYAIKELNIGFPGKYDTLEDIKLCKNLRILTINGGGDKKKRKTLIFYYMSRHKSIKKNYQI